MQKIAIVGGVAGGATVAARLRRLSEHAEITIFERGEYISYANCGLPYYIGSVIKDRERLFLQTPKSFGTRFNLKVKVLSEVVSINRESKTISVKDVKTGNIFEEKYDTLVLSPGAEPIKPPIEGIDIPKIFTLRNVSDTDNIKKFINENNPKKAVVIGGGFIGLEMAENLKELGISTSIVEAANQVMAPLDRDMASFVHSEIKKNNIILLLNNGVKKFYSKDEKVIVVLQSGDEIEADMAILSIGVKPESKLAIEAGLEIGNKKGIVINEYLQTSDPDIFAVGDAVEFKNPITGESVITYLAGPANRQARLAADNIIKGNTRKYSGSIGTGIVKVFDLTVATTGVNEKSLGNFDYNCIITVSGSHAGYYPGATVMTIKMIFEKKTGKVLGAQIIGYDGVDKRIDTIASVIKRGGDIYDLQELELAYAPPFSSAKDPVNISGYAAENILVGDQKIVCPMQLDELLEKEDVFLLDVRTKHEYSLGTIEDAENIPVDNLRENLSKIPKDKKIIIFCAVGLRGYLATKILINNGYENVYNLTGGFKVYGTFKSDCESIPGSNCNSGLADKKEDNSKKKVDIKAIEVDACGIQCPGPVLRLKQEIEKLSKGQQLKITASDPGFYSDVQSWTNVTGNRLIFLNQEKGKVIAVVEKQCNGENQDSSQQNANISDSKSSTLVVFSDDMDKVLASFVIANGAAAMGRNVTMFFTFWGLNAIKKRNKPSVAKDFMGKMFSLMMPKTASKLKLSKMNMLGAGSVMMKFRMKSLKIDSLDKMIQDAIDNGVKFVGCQMSMDVMGVKKEELLDVVEIGGVASYMEFASKANHNLFI